MVFVFWLRRLESHSFSHKSIIAWTILDADQLFTGSPQNLTMHRGKDLPQDAPALTDAERTSL